MSISAQIHRFKALVPNHVRLIAVSKFQPVTAIEAAYQAGQRCFGENRLQELQEKIAYFSENHPDRTDMQWHFIGHVQSKKVKTILPLVALIHAIDSEKLYLQVLKEARNQGLKARILLQVHIAQEETKFGFSPSELFDFAQRIPATDLDWVSICGLMGMASFTDDMQQVRNEFRTLKTCFDQLKSDTFASNEAFTELSMGMSNDYSIAIEEGATLIRVGSTIFGARSTHL